MVQISSDDFAKRISPKRLKDSVSYLPYHRFDDFHFLVDDALNAVEVQNKQCYPLPVPVWNTTNERSTYPKIVTFLNDVVRVCEELYDVSGPEINRSQRFSMATRGKHWWPQLVFSTYDRYMGDTVDGAAPTKPDFGGSAKKLREKEPFFWAGTNRADSSTSATLAMEVPSEVNSRWSEIIQQLGTYARSQKAAIPLRTFSICIGVDHKNCQLRFFQFHSGGVVISPPLDMTSQGGLRDIRNIMFAMYLWQEPSDAGIPDFTDGLELRLPSSLAQNKTSWLVDEVLHYAPSLRGRGTFVVRLKANTPTNRVSLIPRYMPTLRQREYLGAF